MSVKSSEIRGLTQSDLHHPLLPGIEVGTTLAWRAHGQVNRDDFLRDVHVLSEQLPKNDYIINLCEDRYGFLTGFAAALTNHCTTLLPQNRTTCAINEILQDYPSAYKLRDSEVSDCRMKHTELPSPSAPHNPLIARDHLAAIVFTSGSTGRARPNKKTWGSLVTGAQMLQQRFDFNINGNAWNIVATVPPQHMYGLETSILNPLINGVSIYTGPTFFPADILIALQSMPMPRILVTTPVHLNACLESGQQWPELQAIISATAPLPKTLATRAETVFGCPVLEIYGCTEAGSIASRRTVVGDPWLLFEGVCLKETSTGYSLYGDHLEEETPLHDTLQLLDSHSFMLQGRHSDMINIAGKRASLADLNIQLQEIEGVTDGAFLVPDDTAANVTRLIAFAVSETLDAQAICRKLQARIDPVFIPRPLYLVDKLPRNETGKLPRDALETLLERIRRNE
jgi:acyl-coenzyme A synthetase/AMP-(fatty) acid ligase